MCIRWEKLDSKQLFRVIRNYSSHLPSHFQGAMQPKRETSGGRGDRGETKRPWLEELITNLKHCSTAVPPGLELYREHGEQALLRQVGARYPV